MQSLITANNGGNGGLEIPKGVSEEDAIACWAYTYADAMLKEREKARL